MSRKVDAPARTYYLSWIDRRTDPWPNREDIQPGQEAEIDGQPVEFLPADHSAWPGMPIVRNVTTPTASDNPRGAYRSPGILLPRGEGRLLVGPTISALFHPNSQHNVERLTRACILYQEEQTDGPQARLKSVLDGLMRVRGIKPSRIKLDPIRGLTNPTDHSAITKAIKEFVAREDPFDLQTESKKAVRIVVNLSPGTPAMSTCWLLLWWNGTLGGRGSTVEFVQGDGGMSGHDRPDNPSYCPLKPIPMDFLTQFERRPETPPPETPEEESTGGSEPPAGDPYDSLRQEIQQAALLGLPVVLEGERGTGKTFLAHYYHERRQQYRRDRDCKGSIAAIAERKPGKGDGSKGPLRVPDNDGERYFVKVTLSEYSDLDNLRDALFGWARGAFTGEGAKQAYEGLLGRAHLGTLFLDELHHLDRDLQPLLLGPLNTDTIAMNERRYRPKMASYEVLSDFDLVLATNDPGWRKKLMEDLLDRIERVVLRVPAFREFQKQSLVPIWQAWDATMKRRCQTCGLEYTQSGEWLECRQRLTVLFQSDPLTGNWRDLQRLADNALLLLVDARGGRPSPLRWNVAQLEKAIARTFQRPR